MAKTKTKKIPATKTSRITVGTSNHYKLEPAVSRTHYGEYRQHSGGQPYAFPSKRSDGAWFVVSEWSGTRHGLVQQWADDEWTFSKIDGSQPAPHWLRAQYPDTATTIYNLSSRLHGGSTPEEAIAKGLGLSHGSAPAAHATKKRAKSDDAITESDYRDAAKFEMKRFGLTLPEALKLVKDKRYPAILKTIEDWRAQHGWPAASSPLSRGYVFDLIGMQRSK